MVYCFKEGKYEYLHDNEILWLQKEASIIN